MQGKWLHISVSGKWLFVFCACQVVVLIIYQIQGCFISNF